MMRINETPRIEVYLISSGEVPGGIGEAGTTAGAAGACECRVAATGVRLRQLPLESARLSGKQRKS